ncbi:MAG: histidine phosphatase family protein [Clostridiales bacterium]|nr:histidine phosphatase family protein [Clostridiales bacterium]
MSTDVRFLLVRHPETVANVEGRYVGRGNTPFTERGNIQATLLAEHIVSFRPAALYTSPLRRARVVAEQASVRLGVDPIVDVRFTELDFGLAEGLTYAETSERGVQFDFASPDAPVAIGGESRNEIYDRVARTLDAVPHAFDRVAIVTHGGVFRSAIAHLLGLPRQAIWSFHIQNGSVAEIRVLDGHGMVEEFRTIG